MTMTVRELVATPELALRIVAGDIGADRSIEWAHSIELSDPVPWLQGSELLMTTGLKLPASPKEQATYIRRLNKAGIAGIAFGIGLTHEKIPDAVLAAAEKCGLPVLEVPLPTPFIAIAKTVTESYLRQRQERLRRIVEIQQSMMRNALQSGPEGVIDTVCDVLACEAVVVTAQSDVIVDRAEPGSDLAEAVMNESKRNTERRTPFTIGTSSNGINLVVQSLGAGSNVLGYLGVRRAQPIDQEDRLILVQANSLLSLELEKPSEIIEAERRLQADVLRAILSGALHDEDVGRQLAEFGIKSKEKVTISIVKSTASGPERLHSVHMAMPQFPGRYLACEVDSDVVVLCSGDMPELSEVYRTIKKHAMRRPHIGRSRVVGIGQIRDAYRQAGFAAQAARSESSDFREFDQLSTYSLLLSSQSSDALATIADIALEPLIRSDESFRGELLKSLEAFLSNNAQWVPAANALGVHRHTLRNRMRRVEEITGRNLASAHDRTELWLALKAHELSNMTTSRIDD